MLSNTLASCNRIEEQVAPTCSVAQILTASGCIVVSSGQHLDESSKGMSAWQDDAHCYFDTNEVCICVESAACISSFETCKPP